MQRWKNAALSKWSLAAVAGAKGVSCEILAAPIDLEEFRKLLGFASLRSPFANEDEQQPSCRFSISCLPFPGSWGFFKRRPRKVVGVCLVFFSGRGLPDQRVGAGTLGHWDTGTGLSSCGSDSLPWPTGPTALVPGRRTMPWRLMGLSYTQIRAKCLQD